jgi:cysteine-rich repeat protein
LRASYQAPLQSTAAFFGAAVAGDAEEVLVGAPQDASGGDPVGVVHLFDAETGALVRSIVNPDRGPDLFGASVALGAWLVVGAPLARVDGVDAGAAWVIDRATGTALFRLTNPQPSSGAGFGSAVAIVGEYVAVGAPFADDGRADTGAVHVFELASGRWRQTLRNPLQGLQGHFGAALSPGAGGVLVGSPGASRVWGFGAPNEGFASAALVARGASDGPRCGNGIVEGSEACDDGNVVDTDDCRNDCSGRLCCNLDLPPDCDDRDPCTIDAFDPERGCVVRPSGDPACCTSDADCPEGQCRPCLGCFIVDWDCCASGAACIPSNPACEGETCFEAAHCQCAGKLDCDAEAVPGALMAPFVLACDALRLQASVVPDGTPVTRPDLLVARGHAKSARRSLVQTLRSARFLARSGQISRSCRRQVAAQVRVVKRAIPRGKALRACLR